LNSSITVDADFRLYVLQGMLFPIVFFKSIAYNNAIVEVEQGVSVELHLNVIMSI